MVFSVGFSSQISDAQFNTQINNQRLLALADNVNPTNFGAIAAEEKQLNMANALNFSKEKAYEAMNKKPHKPSDAGKAFNTFNAIA